MSDFWGDRRNWTNRGLNCGSCALNLNYWYVPEGPYGEENFHDRHLFIRDLLDEGYNDEFIRNELTAQDVDFMLKTIKGLRPAFTEDFNDLTKVVIAYRIFFCYDDDYDVYDSDFHFQVRRDGQWYEKCGSWDVQKINFSTEPWFFNEENSYDGPIYYFVLE